MLLAVTSNHLVPAWGSGSENMPLVYRLAHCDPTLNLVWKKDAPLHSIHESITWQTDLPILQDLQSRV